MSEVMETDSDLAVGDMVAFINDYGVVFDPEAGSCWVFEIKHSEEAVPQQYRHLIDEQKCAQTEHRYGPITGKFVLYRGESQVVEGIQSQNVEEYLNALTL